MCNDSIDNGYIKLKPVGVIKNNARFDDWEKGFSDLPWQEKIARMEEHRAAVSEIIVDENLDGILDGIEDFSHLTIFFWPHCFSEEKRSILKVHPLGNTQFPLLGIFATRSPVRPNPILATTVRLLERKGNVLKVSGLDALDGSPLLDIKPYNPKLAAGGEIKLPDWMQQTKWQHEEAGL